LPNTGRTTPALAEFAAALRDAKLDWHRDESVALADGSSDKVSYGVSHLPDGVTLLNAPTTSTVLVRQPFVELYDKMTELYADHNIEGTVVSGNPGIGKSVGCGNYMLYRCAQARATVVFEHVKENSTYVFDFHSGVCREHPGRPHKSHVPEMADRRTWYIVDPGDKDSPDNPVECAAFSVTLSSPDKRHFGEFFKRVGCIEYLPVASEAEMVAMSAHVWPSEDADVRALKVSKRMAVAGGLARWVLAREVKYRSYKSEIRKAVADMACDIDQFVGTFRSAGLTCSDLSLAENRFHDHRSRHRLLHLAQVGVNDDGDQHLTMKWASPYVEHLLNLALLKAQDATIIRLSCSLAPGMESLRGTAYEVRMHALLPKGGDFHVRALRPSGSLSSLPTQTSSVLPMSERAVDRFHKLADVVEFKLNRYYQPHSKTFASTDAFEFARVDDAASGTVVMRSFQATVAEKHSLNKDGLTQILAAVARMNLNWKVTEIQHFVVVPPDRDHLFLNEKLKGDKRLVGDDNVQIVEKVLVLHPHMR
jgi:hypothetical protein